MQTPRFHHLLVTALLATAFIVLPHSARAQTPTITVLHDFTRLDGSYPTNGLLLASDGNFYGTTPTGGPGTFTGADYGTVFRITQAGVFTNLVNFTSDNGTNPYAPPIEGSDGDLYGTTAGGGPLGPTRNGTVFKMTKAGVLTTLLEFPYDPTTDTFPNGLSPQAALVQGSDGNYYGTTVGGGTPNIQNTAGHGTIFEMSPAGALLQSVTVHQSNGEPGDPRAPLIQASNGNFYGTSYEGGGDTNAGTIFEFTPEGMLTTLHSFVGGAGNTGDRPYDGLLQGSDGNFYGTTEYGGTAELGTVFKITPAGDYTVLVNFTGPNGEQPFASLIQASDGNFYGTASLGGTDSLGTIFQLTPAGVFTTIYNFSKNEALGAFPRGALVQGSDGNLYGTTMGGGANAFGTVFRLNIVPQAALFNISTRLNVGTGDNVLIGGFIVTGSQPKEVIVRAIGPALSGFGVSGALADPVLELHEPDGTVITNDNWKDTQESAITATNLAPSNDLESAIVATLPPGLYTAIVTGNNNTTGVALVEAYDLDQTVDSQLANISTRGFVDTGDNVLIGGFIVGGPDGVDSTAVVRALGPSLSGAVGGSVLADPNLELHDIDGAVVASNDNWKDGADMQTIIDDGLAPTNAKESALLANLPPGAYTAIVSGVENGSGIGLVEVYNLQ
ncbi:MAG TPA: choice-of-anchor tandem repeat GloVer-containing protein [Chthoniobacterales bacterium]